MTTTATRSDVAPTGGPKYEVDIEGTVHNWERSTISVPELRTLGGFPAGTAVEEIDLEANTQRTLPESEVVELKPGHGFSKKIKFGRG